MNHRKTSTMNFKRLATTTLLTLAAAQMNNRMPGVYRISSLYSIINGTLTPNFWGSNPIVTLIFTSKHVIVQNSNPRLPLFPPDHYFTQPGTPEQNAAIVQGTVSHSGTYEVGPDGVFANITFIGSTIPNYVGLTVGNEVFWFVLRENGSGIREVLELRRGLILVLSGRGLSRGREGALGFVGLECCLVGVWELGGDEVRGVGLLVDDVIDVWECRDSILVAMGF